MMSDATVSEAGSPVVAILTMDDPARGFRGNRNNFIDLIEAGKQAGLTIYVTTVQNLKLHASRIIGYSYNGVTKSWERRWFPLPQVVYNRIPEREDEWIPEVRQKIEECLAHPNVRLFNQSFFSKWLLFKWLRSSRKTRRFVPLTRKYDPAMKLLPLMRKYPFLYLKPEKGKAGKGIMRISRQTGNRGYQLDAQEKNAKTVYRYPTLRQLKERLNAMIGNQEYIVQQGIRLASYKSRPFDLRVLVQKNSRGVWTVTGIGARLAGELSITTHVPRGGSIENPRRLLTSHFSAERAANILRRARRSALIIARQIERASKAELGELSLDLGVDRQARIWFFEANAKPMKFDEPDIRRKSLARLMQYCKYLTGKKHGSLRQDKPKSG